ncbi:hypothetical protein TNCV_3033101 [Trichonephila clavipes]|nr:hypothetical protein TNCV_3033101 [Trichonephila clavipes]
MQAVSYQEIRLQLPVMRSSNACTLVTGRGSIQIILRGPLTTNVTTVHSSFRQVKTLNGDSGELSPKRAEQPNPTGLDYAFPWNLAFPQITTSNSNGTAHVNLTPSQLETPTRSMKKRFDCTSKLPISTQQWLKTALFMYNSESTSAKNKRLSF